MNITMHPLRELLLMFRGRRRELQCPRQIDEEIAIDAYEMVANEAVERSQQIEATAHKAEVHDIEALSVGESALAHDSDGGAVITRNEWAKIKRLVSRSAEYDRAVGEKAKVESA